MSHLSLKSSLLTLGILAIPLFAYLFWSTPSQTLSLLPKDYQTLGSSVKQDFESIPTLPMTEEQDSFTLTDNTSDGIDIQFANEDKTLQTNQPKLNLSFPKDYSKPIEVKLDDKRTIEITDLGGNKSYQTSTLGSDQVSQEQNPSFFQKLFPKKQKTPQTYLRYQSSDERKSLLYAYQKDQASGEKKLKHWTLYENGTGVEQEEYKITNAKVRVNENGIAEVFYYTEQDLKNDQAVAEVDSNLMERAQRTLAKEMGDDLLNGNKTPDFTIPKPYYLDKAGEKHETEWKWNDEKSTLSLSFSPESYPVALDPTLAFTAPGQSNTGSVISGESGSFGYSMTSGDFNADGKTDLAVGASGYSSAAGRAYVFYNDGSYHALAAGADVIITGDALSQFGYALTAGDFNADGKTDLVVGAYAHPVSGNTTGRTYVFYNDGSYSSSAASADVTITGEGQYNSFGSALEVGDINKDGKEDLVVAANNWNNNGTGKVYVFYNGSITTENASGADLTIAGSGVEYFGTSVTVADFDADGDSDIAVGAQGYSSYTGRAYVFYSDGSFPSDSSTADVTITGGTTFNFLGSSIDAGDFNADGKVDLVVGANGYSSNTGRAYIFYNGSIITENVSGADVTITGDAGTNYFGTTLATGDFNADGRIDLAVSAVGHSSSTGRAYIFYNDGSIPTTGATADVVITGETTTTSFGVSFAAGDFNSDGRTDLAVGAYQYASSAGRAYIFFSQNGQVNTNQTITGTVSHLDEFGNALATGDLNSDGRMDLVVGAYKYASSDDGRVFIFYGDGQIPTTSGSADVTIGDSGTSNYFGRSLVTGDFNADGKTDLAVGSDGYSTNTGRVYIFYGDGSIPTTAGTADVTIVGESTSNYFGYALTAGDFNFDGETDLAVGAYGYTTNDGRVYIFYNDGSIPTTAATADVTISSSNTDYYVGLSLAAGDLNSDGRIDLITSGHTYGGGNGFTYVFYNDGSIPTTTGSADITITAGGTATFGDAFAVGDFNADGRMDLAVGGDGHTTNTGKVYVYYNDGSFPTSDSTADLILTGEASNTYFGISLVAGDFNADGRTDLAAGSYGYSTSTGRTYVFYNDGSLPTTPATADVIISGSSTSDSFGQALGAGDMNGDGRVDLIVGAQGYSSSTGRVYIYETRENFAWQIQKQVQPGSGALRTRLNTSGQELKITGESGSGLGRAMTTGDLNNDGKPDLIVGANTYSTNTGRVYVFYSDGSLATGASSADMVITGEVVNSYFGIAMTTSDWNADGKTDLAVGASAYGGVGRAYVFYNDGFIPSNATSADAIITGSGNDCLGGALTSGDLNSDGKSDLVVTADQHCSGTSDGRTHIFYSGNITTENSSGADITITGESNSYFGLSATAGDFNADGRTDLAVGARAYSSNTGRVYIFYNDVGGIPTTAATADVIITGQGFFGASVVAGDLNADGKTDLAVGADSYSSFTGRAYLFYADGTNNFGTATCSGTPAACNASDADVIISGTGGVGDFGFSLAVGDWNADGRTDLAVGAYALYSATVGAAYIYYNDVGGFPTTAATADVILAGEASSYFGTSLAAGDFNGDGRTDLAVGAIGYSSSKGRVYVYTFGNDPVITGGATGDSLGQALAAGDFNADGRIDLAVGAVGYSTYAGRVYLFYNDGGISAAVSGADVTITGETAGDQLGYAFGSGDFNRDGKTDLVVGAYGYDSYGGRAYIFYNDGSIPTTAATADVSISSEATGNTFATSFVTGDFNTDGYADLAIGASEYSSIKGRAYIFYNDGSIPTTAATADVIITGEANSNNFGGSLASGDFNTDGRTDLAVGAFGYSSAKGRAYIFYNDGSMPTTAATADVAITGTANNDSFGMLVAGDFNADGRSDLLVGASGYQTVVGRAYIFYNDGSIPTTAATADVTVDAEGGNTLFGGTLSAGDWNADGRTDFAIGAVNYTSLTGRVYLFNNDGSIPTTAATADMIYTGQNTSDSFSSSLVAGDFNADGKADLAIGALGYSSSTGRVYVISSEIAASSSSTSTASFKGSGTFKGSGKLK